MPTLKLLVGPPGSGKSTFSKQLESQNPYLYRVSQDDQGKEHLTYFQAYLHKGQDVLVDRMNFNKVQRERYLKPAREAGYTTEIIVLHEPRDVCMARMLKRIENEGHPTVATQRDASSALETFFKFYQRPTEDEADVITFKYPEGEKPSVVICDLDGTLCNIDHRLHFVKNGKKNWPAFFAALPDDDINEWCNNVLEGLRSMNQEIIFCSGRPDNYRKQTQEWLDGWEFNDIPLYMRPRGDSREDSLVKEIILDFEILTRYTPMFAIDDRKRVVDMWRKRGITCLACADGEF